MKNNPGNPAAQAAGSPLSKAKRTNRDYLLLIVQGGVIAAIYASLTYLAGLWGLAYGPFQFRLSEALTILPVFTPAAIPGLTIGCFLGNLGSPLGLVDVLCGTAASLLAAILTRAVSRVRVKGIPVLAPLPPILCNAVVIGLELTLLGFMPQGLNLPGFLAAALEVGFGQLVVCYGLGIPLYALIVKTGVEKHIFYHGQRAAKRSA